jgi:hypothetical protein
MLRYIAPLALLALSTSTIRAADQLDEKFIEKAKSVLETVKKKGFTNVGVLKFLVRQGDGPERDNAGDLNLTLANKMQVALVLANNDPKFGIIDKPSEAVVREKLLLANHRTEEGRKAFFVRKYELAWSRDMVDASGFITGTATISADLTKLTVRFQVFDATGKIEDIEDDVAVDASPELIAQAGFSYALAPAKQKAIVTGDTTLSRDVLRRDAVEQANKAAKPAADEPFAPLATSPVKWSVLYNGKPVTVTLNSIPEPKSIDKVEFTLTNPTTETYAVVLLVNGENTLYQERVAPQVCRKWVLPPDASLTIRGFQTAPDTVVPFAVLPPDQTPPEAVWYGEHAGTFRMVVFHGKMSPVNGDSPTVVGKNGDEGAALALSRTRGSTRPGGVKPQTLKALQADIRGRMGTDGARGYVVKGNGSEKFETTSVEFVATPDIPVADVSLRYFTPKK